jgi:hypothetical protein
MKTMTFAQGGRGELTFARPFSDYIVAVVLLAAAAEGIEIPAGARFVVFNSTGDFYAVLSSVAVPKVAAVPSATVDDGSASELNPGHWSVAGYDGISIAVPDDCVVTMSFYS